jgi:hypothetical protein
MELRRLMTTRMRGPMGEVNRLIVAFKLHFLGCLPPGEQRQQIDLLVEACDKELVRLADLRAYPPLAAGGRRLLSWLELEISEVEARRAWFAGQKGEIQS